MSTKLCKECNTKDALKGEKYCKACRSSLLKQMESDGYLQDTFTRNEVSEQYGRTVRDLKALGGASELNNDGDDDDGR